ncbi:MULTISPECIES: helix-turn-helix domain-containing transcriptional regulator [unclassified Bradyrhizobium]|uniref:helix-turn-helix domain-containing transcriptional regulator n=1 Tax=unclassified Bradyrhizobium TaxID=2631580 RepID=UPI00359CB92E
MTPCSRERSRISEGRLYKALRETGTPEFETVMRIIGALGLTLSAQPRQADGHQSTLVQPEGTRRTTFQT